MAASSASASAQPASVQHIHFDDQCPVCDQEIPPDRLEEVHGRYAVRLREQAAQATAQLQEQHRKDRAQADAKAKADLEEALKRQREESAAREKSIREEEERKRDALLAERLAQAEATRKEQEETLGHRAAEAEGRAKTATEASAALKLELEQAKHAGAEALDLEKKAAAEREAAARLAGKTEAETAAEQRAQAAASAAQGVITDLQAKLAAAETNTTDVVADLNGKIAEANAARLAAEEEAKTVKQNQETVIAARVQEVREPLEKAKTEAVQAAEKRHLDDRHAWQAKFEELQRKLDDKTAAELGEGAEIRLYKALKEAFPEDRIREVKDGAPGADVIQEVVLNGKVAGKIVFDSKNRGQWRWDYVTKLRQDQIAEGADHAILSTNKFPKETRELHLHDGVIIACPARVVVLAAILRSHILATHELRMSNDERAAKTEKLYAYVTSSQCRQLIESIETLVGRIEKIDVDELKAHKAWWAKRGSLLKDILKANGDFRYTLDSIIGTADTAE